MFIGCNKVVNKTINLNGIHIYVKYGLYIYILMYFYKNWIQVRLYLDLTETQTFYSLRLDVLSSTALPIRKILVCYRPAIRKLEWSESDPAPSGPGHGWPLSGIIVLIRGDPNHPIDKPVIFNVDSGLSLFPFFVCSS